MRVPLVVLQPVGGVAHFTTPTKAGVCVLAAGRAVRGLPRCCVSITHFASLSRNLFSLRAGGGCLERLPDTSALYERIGTGIFHTRKRDGGSAAGFSSDPPEVKFRSAYCSWVGK